MGRYEGPWWAVCEEHVVEHRPTPPIEVGGVFGGGEAYAHGARACGGDCACWRRRRTNSRPSVNPSPAR